MIELVKKGKKRKKETIYPYFGITDSGIIVLFTKEYTGVKVAMGNSGDTEPVGSYHNNRAEHLFSPVEEPLTFRNKEL